MGGLVIAVDTWLGSLPTAFKEYEKSPWLLHNGYPQFYYVFLSNMVNLGCSDYVVPFPLTSPQAANYLRELKAQPDLIHIDGDHTTKAVL